ncbi:uncharacterized protein EMH_0023410 [Eimeria mitis]|uniref:Uncharacterized protein n=1 Tax=Eimeria mitis TaxID=44415 RepID=U6KFK7_9EIME|nr:uncharacterized protein EMH_0023410 [Eimeria mitis]CDJ35022.1 hypothetical protein EMH_0023410 [Eimeria mitis]
MSRRKGERKGNGQGRGDSHPLRRVRLLSEGTVRDNGGETDGREPSQRHVLLLCSGAVRDNGCEVSGRERSVVRDNGCEANGTEGSAERDDGNEGNERERTSSDGTGNGMNERVGGHENTKGEGPIHGGASTDGGEQKREERGTPADGEGYEGTTMIPGWLWWQEGDAAEHAPEYQGSLCSVGRTAVLQLEIVGHRCEGLLDTVQELYSSDYCGTTGFVECFTGDFLFEPIPYSVILGIDWLVNRKVAWYFQSDKLRTYVNGRWCDLPVLRKEGKQTQGTLADSEPIKTAADHAYDELARQVAIMTTEEAAAFLHPPSKRYQSRHRAGYRVKIKDILREARKDTAILKRAIEGLHCAVVLPAAEPDRVVHVPIERQGPLLCAIVEHMKTVLEMIGGAAYFLTLDLETGFRQIRMEREYRWKTAFRSVQGLFEYKVPDSSKPYTLYTDASGYAIGAVLEQEGKPVGFLSQVMSPAQQKYSIYDQELLALIPALDKWRLLLRGAKVTAYTDHQALTYLQRTNMQNPLRGRTARWVADILLSFVALTYTSAYMASGASVLLHCRNSYPIFFIDTTTTLALDNVANGRRFYLSCRASKALSQKPAGLLQPLLVHSRRWSQVSLDFITELPLTPRGHDCILVIVDSLSKMAHIIPTKKSASTADTIELFAQRLIRYHGFPDVLISDRDPRFQSQLWQQHCQRFRIKRAMSSPYHRQSDGQTERVNRTLEQMLPTYIQTDEREWERLLPALELAYNTTSHSSTELSPFEVMICQNPVTAADLNVVGNLAPTLTPPMTKLFQQLCDRAQSHIIKEKWQQKRYAEAHRRDAQYNPGDRLVPDRSRDPQMKSKEAAVGWLPVTGPDGTPTDIYEVDYNLDQRGSDEDIQYLVKWRGAPEDRATWEPAANLTNCPALLRAWRRHLRRARKAQRGPQDVAPGSGNTASASASSPTFFSPGREGVERHPPAAAPLIPEGS